MTTPLTNNDGYYYSPRVRLGANTFIVGGMALLAAGMLYAASTETDLNKRERETARNERYLSLPKEVRSYDLNRDGVLDTKEAQGLAQKLRN